MKDYNVIGKAGDDKPLPDVLETMWGLEQFIQLLVTAAWDKWPDNFKLDEKAKADLEKHLHVGKRWLIGARAAKMRWHLHIMSDVVEHFPTYFEKIGEAQLGKSQQAMGAVQLRRSIPVNDLLRLLADKGFIVMAGRA